MGMLELRHRLRAFAIASAALGVLAWTATDAAAHGGGFGGSPGALPMAPPPPDAAGGGVGAGASGASGRARGRPAVAKAPIGAPDASTGGVRGGSRRASRGPTTGTPVTFLPDDPGSSTPVSGNPFTLTLRAISWEDWWFANASAYIDLVPRLDAMVVSGGAGRLSSRGRRATTSFRPDRETVHTVILPALRQLLADPDSPPEVLEAAALAIGRCADDETTWDAVSALTPMLHHESQGLQTATAVALGALRSPTTVNAMSNLLVDAETLAHAGGTVPWTVRAAAALALGLSRQPSAVEPLKEAVTRLGESEREIRIAALIGLGLLGDERDPGLVAFLVQVMREQADPALRGVAATALGRLGRAEALPALIQALDDDGAPIVVRQCAVLALGRLGKLGDGQSLPRLITTLQKERDELTRHHAILAVAHLASRRGLGGEPADRERTLAVDTLEREIRKPTRKSNRPWAALAAGILGRARADTRESLGEALLERFEAESQRSVRGALALGVGMTGLPSAGPVLMQELASTRDEALAAYLALALGLLRHGDAADLLAARCIDRRSGPPVHDEPALGLAMLGDARAVDEVFYLLQQADHPQHLLPLARTLGTIGGSDHVRPLVDLALDVTQHTGRRAAACLALGRIGERDAQPWHVPISEDHNLALDLPLVDAVLAMR